MQQAIDTIRTLVHFFKRGANKTPCILIDLVDHTLQELSNARHPDTKDGKTWARSDIPEKNTGEHVTIRAGAPVNVIDHIVNSNHDNHQSKLDKIDEYVQIVSRVMC